MFQIPMVGSDVCGFGGNTTETLCARWASLGAFYTFYRNHDGDTSIYQEFYRWDVVAESARNAIEIRYRMLDYLYTNFHQQTVDGTPVINPLFFMYPEDENTFPIQWQFFYGDSVLVSPVVDENSTSVDIYLPDDIFYDWYTHEAVRGNGSYVSLVDVPYTAIPLHIKGGSIIPLRVTGANTTTELRKKNFEILIAPGLDGKASGSLYLDEGDAIEQPAISEITFKYENGQLSVDGTFGYDAGVVIEKITLLGESEPVNAGHGYGQGRWGWGHSWTGQQTTSNTTVNIPLTGPYKQDCKSRRGGHGGWGRHWSS